MENAEEIRRSYALQTAWQSGAKVVNKLIPPSFSRIAVPFTQTWREWPEPTLEWGAQDFSIMIPEGVRCLSAAYLNIDIPAAEFKAYPGLYIIDQFRIRSAGQIVYECDYGQHLSDYCESLTDQKLRQFANIYLGGSEASTGSETRSVKLPLLLPNSTYLRRSNNSTSGHGVFGAYTGQNRVELSVTLNSAAFVAQTGTAAPASILGKCSLMYHCVQVPNELRRKYEDLRGYFHTVIRRFTQLTPGWRHYTTAGELVVDSVSQPNGTVAEIMLLAVPHVNTAADRRKHNYIKPTYFEVVSDMITQKRLDTKRKVETELFTNGFNPPVGFDSPGRLCFANHCASDMTSIYLGGYNMSSATNVQFRFKFDQEVDWRLVSVAYANCKIDGAGVLTSTLDGS